MSPNVSKTKAYRRRHRRGTIYTAKKFDLTHSCGACLYEEDDVCTLHENVPAFENKANGISTKYFGICPDWESKSDCWSWKITPRWELPDEKGTDDE
jgi:hypothetical protein